MVTPQACARVAVSPRACVRRPVVSVCPGVTVTPRACVRVTVTRARVCTGLSHLMSVVEIPPQHLPPEALKQRPTGSAGPCVVLSSEQEGLDVSVLPLSPEGQLRCPPQQHLGRELGPKSDLDNGRGASHGERSVHG